MNTSDFLIQICKANNLITNVGVFDDDNDGENTHKTDAGYIHDTFDLDNYSYLNVSHSDLLVFLHYGRQKFIQFIEDRRTYIHKQNGITPEANQLKELIFEKFSDGYIEIESSPYPFYLRKDEKGKYFIGQSTSGMFLNHGEMVIPAGYYKSKEDLYEYIKLHLRLQ